MAGVIDRRQVLTGLLLGASGLALAACETGNSETASATTPRGTFKPAAQWVPQEVDYAGDYAKGTIVVDPANHFLYLILGDGKARRYGIAVGAEGKGLKGKATILRKTEWPSWTPTAAMMARAPERYAPFANGMPGGPKNPMGARALYLYQNGQDTMYRIHGTNQPESIGTSVSQGCIRLINEHVEDLYDRVPIGTKVVVL